MNIKYHNGGQRVTRDSGLPLWVKVYFLLVSLDSPRGGWNRLNEVRNEHTCTTPEAKMMNFGLNSRFPPPQLPASHPPPQRGKYIFFLILKREFFIQLF